MADNSHEMSSLIFLEKSKKKKSNFRMFSASVVIGTLSFTTLWTNSADDQLMMFFLFFTENSL